ncbi:Serine/threonine-protein kinase TOR [Linum grandiflorum]
MCLDWMMTMKLNFGFWETLLQVEMEASLDELPMDLWPSFATSEDYHSTVAVNSLMRILRDPSLASYHQKVVGSLMFIFKVLPDLFHTVRTCYDSLKDFITWKLGTLVSIVRQHIHKYLPELLSLISELWSSIGLLATNRPSRGYPEKVPTSVNNVNLYCYYAGTLDEHMHLLFPALIRLFKMDAPVDIRRATIKTLTRLIPLCAGGKVRRKPGSSCCLDKFKRRPRSSSYLTFIHSKFLAPLPPSMMEFMVSLHKVFPQVIDVNHLVKETGLRKNVASIPYIISYLKNRFPAPVAWKFHSKVSYLAADEGEIHGHNVVSISELFAKLCCILKLTPGSGEQHVENHGSSSLVSIYVRTSQAINSITC